MKKKFIAYEGDKLTIEWYFNDQGKSKVQEYFEELEVERKKKILNLFKLLGDQGKIFNKEKFRHEEDQIYAFKSSADRFFCFFFDGAKVIVTNAYEKKSKKMPAGEKQRALKIREDYIQRFKRGMYYD